MPETKGVEGLLLLDKPCGISSNKALQQVRSFFSKVKAGHGGSLDPLASGMLPIFLGKATKFSRFLLEAPKRYRVIARLGITTTTGDCEGTVIQECAVPAYTERDIQSCLKSLEGIQQQCPPLYSALKLEGKPLYAYARKGIEVQRATRTIEIQALQLLELNEELVCFEVSCSKGTYVRTLVETLGERLGCGAHVVYLRRTQVANFQTEQMLALDALLEFEPEEGIAQLIPVEHLVQHFPLWQFSPFDWEAFRHGRIPQAIPPVEGWLRAYDPDTRFVGVIRCQGKAIQERCLLAL